MEIRVHGKHLRVGEELRSLAEQKVGHASRIFGEDATVDVEVEQRNNPRLADAKYRVEITSRVAGHIVRVEAEASDERSAVDLATEKFERMLRRLKERLIQRSRGSSHKGLNEESPAADNIEESGDPHIVRVKQFAMKPMMPEEAALQMDMLDHAFFFFLNGETDTYGVLYRRRDGSLGLIEPS